MRGLSQAKMAAGLGDMASAVLPAIESAITGGIVTETEAKRGRDVVGSRVRHLNHTLGWEIPADTDALVRRGGCAMS